MRGMGGMEGVGGVGGMGGMEGGVRDGCGGAVEYSAGRGAGRVGGGQHAERACGHVLEWARGGAWGRGSSWMIMASG